MKPDEPIRAAGGSGHGYNRQAGGVGGKDGRPRADPIELPPESVLELQVFGHRFYNDVAVSERLELGGE
jgi:hypothetical protein